MFKNKTEIIKEIKNDTDLGKKHVKIQLRYLQSLKSVHNG